MQAQPVLKQGLCVLICVIDAPSLLLKVGMNGQLPSVVSSRVQALRFTICVALQANKTRQIEAQASGLLTAIDCFKDGIMLVDTSTPLWNIIFINDTWTRVTGDLLSTTTLLII